MDRRVGADGRPPPGGMRMLPTIAAVVAAVVVLQSNGWAVAKSSSSGISRIGILSKRGSVCLLLGHRTIYNPGNRREFPLRLRA